MTRWTMVMVLTPAMSMILMVSPICAHWEYEKQRMPAYVTLRAIIQC